MVHQPIPTIESGQLWRNKIHEATTIEIVGPMEDQHDAWSVQRSDMPDGALDRLTSDQILRDYVLDTDEGGGA